MGDAGEGLDVVGDGELTGGAVAVAGAEDLGDEVFDAGDLGGRVPQVALGGGELVDGCGVDGEGED